VIRLKVNPGDILSFTDLIRGEITFDTTNVDDKVLLKADGMPTYHLAVVVDDYLMKITHAFRGEEWLPSAPVHILLWTHLFGIENMVLWAHLPLILKPDGNGKLSKRDGDRLGFPVYAMDWKDPVSRDVTKGFREIGFLPQAFNNLLAVLGWNDGTEQEIFSMNELIDKFSLDRVHKGGAKFDFEKAKWFNHEWIKKLNVSDYISFVKADLNEKAIIINDDEYLAQVMNIVKDRCTLLTDFYEQSYFFFKDPETLDEGAIRSKWDDNKKEFFESFIAEVSQLSAVNHVSLENSFKNLAGTMNIKVGELQMIFRVMLVGSKMGPGVFIIAETIGVQSMINRIKKALKML
jgi:glutamyl-tRNA synthetase